MYCKKLTALFLSWGYSSKCSQVAAILVGDEYPRFVSVNAACHSQRLLYITWLYFTLVWNFSCLNHHSSSSRSHDPNPQPSTNTTTSQGLDARDAAFMARLRTLAQEALTWSHLSQGQRLLWATVLQLDVVPLQEMTWVGWLGWCLVGASKKSWGDMIYKVRHVHWRNPEGCLFSCLLKVFSVQIYGWACRSCYFVNRTQLGRVHQQQGLGFFGHAWFRGQQCWMGMCFICVFGISSSSWRFKGAASMVSGAAEHHQKTSRPGRPGMARVFFPVGISNHAENAAMAISAIIPWLMADQHAAQLNST